MTNRNLFMAVCLLIAGLASGGSVAQARPTALPGFTVASYASGLGGTTAMTFAPDGRLFVCEQGGNLRVIKDGVLQGAAFASLPVDSIGERGLLGVALDPNFGSNGFVYVYHTVAEGNTRFNRVSRFTANGDVAAAGSQTTILTLDNLSGATNHNGGAIHFGTDGKLYVAVGDNANPANARSLNNRLGKILRINPDGSIPGDNPTSFAGVGGTTSGANQAIYALGLRNPYTFAVDPATGQTYINDVGQSAFEEINVLGAGRNYGWNQTEGMFDPAAFPDFTNPLVAYAHGSGPDQGRSITGGSFYRPAQNTFGTAFVGDYFYGDFANGWIRGVDAGTGNTYAFASDLGNISDLQVGQDGALYYAARNFSNNSATIQRIGGPIVIPEPSTVLLFAATGGLFILALRKRR